MSSHVGTAAAFWRRVRSPIEKTVARLSLVEDTPFLEPAQFAWMRGFESHWPEIKAEFDAAVDDGARPPNIQDILVGNRELVDDDRWKALILVGYGFRIPANCVRFPRTMALVDAVPGVNSALFSILRPGARIPAHRDPYKGLVTYHLGLRVPTAATRCTLRVGAEERHWEEGRSLIFDPTHVHEVWNDTDEPRLIFFLDVVRPLRQPAAMVNRAVLKLIALSPYVQDARRRQAAWDLAAGGPEGRADQPSSTH